MAAFLIFVAIMLWIWRTNYRVLKKASSQPQLKHYEGQTLCILLISVGFGIGIAFGNYIYDPMFPIVLGLTAAT